MTAHRAVKIFSHVVLSLMSGGIAYAGFIAITIASIYWIGISV